MIVKVIYSNQIGYCVKDDSINLLQKRHCGTKLMGHYFVNLYEIYYLLNYKECQVCEYDGTIEQIINQEHKNWIKDPVEFLNHFKPNVNKLCAYMHIRNSDMCLRCKIPNRQKIKQELSALPRKKIDQDTPEQESEFILYKTLQDYKNNVNGVSLEFVNFSDDVNYDLLLNVQMIGLMENGEVKLITNQIHSLM